MALVVFGSEGIKILALILEIINIGLLSGLLYLYIKSYRQIKIGFTVGLIFFALILLLKSILSIGFILFSNIPLNPPYLLLSIIQLIALAVLLKITLDY
jgi:hypothetical protein